METKNTATPVARLTEEHREALTSASTYTMMEAEFVSTWLPAIYGSVVAKTKEERAEFFLGYNGYLARLASLPTENGQPVVTPEYLGVRLMKDGVHVYTVPPLLVSLDLSEKVQRIKGALLDKILFDITAAKKRGDIRTYSKLRSKLEGTVTKTELTKANRQAWYDTFIHYGIHTPPNKNAAATAATQSPTGGFDEFEDL